MTPRILVIAGSDSGGGAGIQADIRTITMLGGHAMTAVTAVTAQNTRGVSRIHPVPADVVVAQMRDVIDDLGVDAVKIGMIGSAETANAVAGVLEDLCSREGGNPVWAPAFAGAHETLPIVLDPVMVSTSGAVLADADTIAALTRLMRLATVVTPNAPELAALTGWRVASESDALAAGRALAASIDTAVLAKGGHLGPDVTGQVLQRDGSITTDLLADDLIYPDGTDLVWTAPRIDTRHTHGTGCTLASAIAEGLGRGMDLPAAIARARLFVRIALHEAPGFGGGNGPMGHHKVRLDTPSAATLNQVTLPARDHAASLAFYTALGLTPIVDARGEYARFEGAGGTTLSIHAGAAATVFIEVPDLDAAVASARARGIAVADPVDQSWGWREARLADPAGNALCLYTAGEHRRFPPWRLRCPD